MKHSVQNASYEQKDPLVIFKLESVKLFDDMVNQMNNRIVSILMRAQIPEIQREEVREALRSREASNIRSKKTSLLIRDKRLLQVRIRVRTLKLDVSRFVRISFQVAMIHVLVEVERSLRIVMDVA